MTSQQRKINKYRQRELLAMQVEPTEGIAVAQVAHDLEGTVLIRNCLGGRPKPLTEKIVADLIELLAVVGKARKARLTVSSYDDPMRRLCGFIVEEKNTAYQVTLESLMSGKYNAIPKGIASLFKIPSSKLKEMFKTSQGRRELAGEPKVRIPSSKDFKKLERIFMAEAKADRLVNMGELKIKRPA